MKIDTEIAGPIAVNTSNTRLMNITSIRVVFTAISILFSTCLTKNKIASIGARDETQVYFISKGIAFLTLVRKKLAKIVITKPVFNDSYNLEK